MSEIMVRRVSTADLRPDEIRAIRAILDAAFEDEDGFAEEDWEHALGGTHVVLDVDGEILAHAAVVERPLEVAGRRVRTGYVEAVATKPGHHGRGYGSAVMTQINDIIRAGFDLGLLGTGRFSFYERLGWEHWQGAGSVRTADGDVPTPDDDGYLMALRTPASATIDTSQPISCDWRSGDVW
jgi:aminoglycoside 2'-N-acetyltransferase I